MQRCGESICITEPPNPKPKPQTLKSLSGLGSAGGGESHGPRYLPGADAPMTKAAILQAVIGLSRPVILSGKPCQ